MALHSFSLSLAGAHSLFLAHTHTHTFVEDKLTVNTVDRLMKTYGVARDEGKIPALILSKYQPNFSPPPLFAFSVVVIDAYATR